MMQVLVLSFKRGRFDYFKIKNGLTEYNFLFLQLTDFDLLTADRIVASVIFLR